MGERKLFQPPDVSFGGCLSTRLGGKLPIQAPNLRGGLDRRGRTVPTEQDLERRAEAWAAAELRGDTAFLDDLLADGSYCIGLLGFRETAQPSVYLTNGRANDRRNGFCNLDTRSPT